MLGSWRDTWAVIGSTSITLGLLVLLTVKEPSKANVIAQDVDREEINEL